MLKKVDELKFIYRGTTYIDDNLKEKIKNYIKEKNIYEDNEIIYVSNIINNNEIEIKTCNYSYYMYCKENKLLDIKCLFSGGYITTKDNYIILVLNSKTINKDYEELNLAGGMADNSDITNGIYYEDNCLKREINEELGIYLSNENYKIELKYLKVPSEDENNFCYPIGTIFEIKTNYTKNELINIFYNSRHDNEVKELVFFSKENYETINDYKYKKEYIVELFNKIFKD